MKKTRNRNYANCVFLINMIRSGLVNTKRLGGFEEGYPHQRDNQPRDETIRPYVQGNDTPIGAASDFTRIMPVAINYHKIFGKTLTPDERMYILREVQQGRQGQMEGVPLPKTNPAEEIPDQPNTGAPVGTYPDSAVDLDDDYQNLGFDVVEAPPMIEDGPSMITGRGVRTR
jgi:hypothetical protein